jgi:toxin ParE1/3/4
MANSVGVVLRPAARADLARIWKDGAERWGSAQADRYADGLFSLFYLLVEFPELSRERLEFTPPVRIHPIGAHLVIYRLEGQGVEIIRILHSHQNLTAYLQEG